MLGAKEALDALYELLLPYEGEVVAGGMGEACQGAVDRYLGMLAGAAGRHDEARARFDAAISVEERLRSSPLAARTRYWYACFLQKQDCGEEAWPLLAASLDAAERLGMAGLARDVRSLAGST